jgi:hypothetical protein
MAVVQARDKVTDLVDGAPPTHRRCDPTFFATPDSIFQSFNRFHGFVSPSAAIWVLE